MTILEHQPVTTETSEWASLSLPRYPRSAAYTQDWALESSAGPNVLWLAEALCTRMELSPGSRVLELGAGNGSGAVFLAREFGVHVWAIDNLFKPDVIAQRVQEADMDGVVFPMNVNAKSLPFPHEWFDAVIALDSLQYFGSDDLYPRYISKFLRPGGSFGAVIPGLRVEKDPADLEIELTNIARMQAETYHDADWWRRHMGRSGVFEVLVADQVADAWRSCAEWYELCARHGVGMTKLAEREAAVWRRDQGQELGLVRVVARRH